MATRSRTYDRVKETESVPDSPSTDAPFLRDPAFYRAQIEIRSQKARILQYMTQVAVHQKMFQRYQALVKENPSHTFRETHSEDTDNFTVAREKFDFDVRDWRGAPSRARRKEKEDGGGDDGCDHDDDSSDGSPSRSRMDNDDGGGGDHDVSSDGVSSSTQTNICEWVMRLMKIILSALLYILQLLFHRNQGAPSMALMEADGDHDSDSSDDPSARNDNEDHNSDDDDNDAERNWSKKIKWLIKAVTKLLSCISEIKATIRRWVLVAIIMFFLGSFMAGLLAVAVDRYWQKPCLDRAALCEMCRTEEIATRKATSHKRCFGEDSLRGSHGEEVRKARTRVLPPTCPCNETRKLIILGHGTCTVLELNRSHTVEKIRRKDKEHEESNLGGAVDGSLAAWTTYGKFKALPQIILELPPKKQKRLYKTAHAIIQNLDWIDAAELTALVMANGDLQKELLEVLIGFIATEL